MSKRLKITRPSKLLYRGRACLSKQETMKAWKLEHFRKKSRIAAAQCVNVSEKTLQRMYRLYGLPSPKRGEKKDHV